MISSRSFVTESSRNKNGPQRRLPRKSHAQHNGVGEKGVDAHTGCQGYGQIGPQPHEERRQGGAPYGGRQGSFPGHARIRKHGWVDEKI